MGPYGSRAPLDDRSRAGRAARRDRRRENRTAEPLRETALAHTLGTGRSAIREAIRQLVQEGLVEYRLTGLVRPRAVGGGRDDVYLAREAIEVRAVRHALERAEPLDLSPLKAALERITAAADATPADQPAGTD